MVIVLLKSYGYMMKALWRSRRTQKTLGADSGLGDIMLDDKGYLPFGGDE